MFNKSQEQEKLILLHVIILLLVSDHLTSVRSPLSLIFPFLLLPLFIYLFSLLTPLTSLILPAERLRVGAPAGVHHGFVVLMLLVLGEAGQRVALPERQQLVLGADAARRPVEGGAGVMRLGGKRVRVRGGGGDLDAGPGAVEGQRAPGSQRVLASPGQVVLRGVEGGRSVVGAALGVVVAGVLVKFFLWFSKRDTELCKMLIKMTKMILYYYVNQFN